MGYFCATRVTSDQGILFVPNDILNVIFLFWFILNILFVLFHIYHF